MKTLTLQNAAKYQITQTFLILVATMALPLMIHLLPNMNGNLAGAVLLPIFWAPMFAAFFFKRHVSILAGIFAPLFNFLILNRPAPEMVVMLSFEIMLFSLIVSWLKNQKLIGYIAAPLAYIAASLTVVLGMSLFVNHLSVEGWINSTLIAFPGILLLTAANLLLIRFRK
ncbi:MAG TPA: hypothetical protein PKO30_04425 [Prolixibacteraceae bacterium]|nr:hypothetical protein [Prolixibacteraceae bacterium]